jgi:glycosyltransferase involved in cell wall biosynthesis
MKIVYLYTALVTVGGADRVITEKANYFAEKFGYDVTIITDSQGDNPPIFPLSPKVHLINLNIMFGRQYGHGLLLRAYYYFKLMYKYKRLVAKELNKIKPDFTISTIGRELDFFSKLKDGSIKIEEGHVARFFIRNFHLMEQRSFLYKSVAIFWRNIMDNAIKKISAIVVLTEDDATQWRHVCNHVYVIPNSLPFYEKYKNNDYLSKDIISVGRLNEQKGYDLLIKAWAMISKKYPGWKIYVYGEGLLKSYLENIVKENDVETSFLFEKPVTDIQNKYLSSAFFVSSSHFEGFGMALIEAMACGLPCVSFNCSCGPADIIKDNEDGFLVKNGDVKKLSEKIAYMIDNPEERAKMGRRAKENVKRYSKPVIMEKWRSLFNHLIEQQ